MKQNAIGWMAYILAVGAMIGCRDAGAEADPTNPATTAPATKQAGVFRDDKLDIALEYPAGWMARRSKDDLLLLVPGGGPEGMSLALDVPDLPVHVPGLIPMGSVQDGYVNDLRKQVGPVQVKQLSPPAIPRAQARLIRIVNDLRAPFGAC